LAKSAEQNTEQDSATITTISQHHLKATSTNDFMHKAAIHGEQAINFA